MEHHEHQKNLTKRDIQVVVEINNYNKASLTSTEDRRDSGTSESAPASTINPSGNDKKKAKIIAKVKPHRRSSTGSSVSTTITTTTSSKPDKPDLVESPGGKSPLSSSKAPAAQTATVTPINLGTSSPIFESGVNTECIQLLRQLWNVHEELVQFQQELLLVLQHIQQNVQYEFDLDSAGGATGSGVATTIKRFKSTAAAFVASAVVGSGRSSPAGTSVSSSPLHVQETTGNLEDTTTGPEDAQTIALRKVLSCPSVDSFIQGLKSITENVTEIEKQYNLISRCQSQCKLILYAKVRHAKKYVIHDRLTVLYTTNHLILTMLQLLSSNTFWEVFPTDTISGHLLEVFQLAEVYNTCLESTYESSASSCVGSGVCMFSTIQEHQIQRSSADVLILPLPNDSLAKPIVLSGSVAARNVTNLIESPINSIPPEASTLRPELNKISVLAQILDAGKNDSPSCRLSLKPYSATKILQLFAQKRATSTSYRFVQTIKSTFTILGPNAHRIPTKSIAANDQETIILSLERFESCVLDEDAKLNPFAKCFSKYPSLLGRGAVKRCENGQERLSGSVRNKMFGYFRQVLWVLVGEIAEDVVLWDYSMGIPLVLYSLDVFGTFRNSLLIGKRFAESNPTPIHPTIDSILSSLNSLMLLLSWDEKMRSGLELAGKIKRPEQIALVRNPADGEWATGVGARFADIVTTCLVLIENGSAEGASRKDLEGGLPKSSQSSTTPEEGSLTDEAQVLFRLDATLEYFKAWVLKRCKIWLNSWAMPAFVASSQRDTGILLQLIKSHQAVFITREIFLSNTSVSIRISAKHRQICSEDFQETLSKLRKMSDDLLLASGPVGRMLALATLQSYMLNPLHWRGVGPNSGLNPDKPSSYVRTLISKVIEPVAMASVEFVSSSAQEAIGKQVIQATCEAWLEYILQKKIKFSEWGALQLLRDFMTLRDWIRNESMLDEEARKGLLQLEILKHCEGVAFLLLRNPGDVLGVGKPSRRTRRVAPTSVATTGSTQTSSPSSMSENSVVEDDIPPEMYVPNQQVWLELRMRRNNLLAPCCQFK